jgi:uncharacterized protein YybS (DUF2232 family)
MKIKDVLGCAGWAALFLLIATLIPFAGPLFSMLAPLPFLFYSSKLGFYGGLKTTLLAVGVIALAAHLAGLPQVVLFCAEFGFLGFVLSELYRRNLTFGYTLFWGTTCMLLLGFLFLFFSALSENMGPLEMLLKYLHTNLKETIEAYKQSGVSEEKAADFQLYGEALINTIGKIYPSLLVIGTGFVVWLNVILSKPLFRMRGIAYPSFAPLEHWRAPDQLIWVLIVAGFALFLLSGSIRLIALNVTIVLMVVYLFQGLSILLFFLNKYHVPAWIRIGVYLLIIFQQIFLGLLAFVGLFDQWIDFRKIHKRMDSPTS